MSLFEARFSVFGPNKKQELRRLIFEIARRDDVSPEIVIMSLPQDRVSFAALKKVLLARRFPELTAKGVVIHPPLSALDIDSSAACDISVRKDFNPRIIRVEPGAEKTVLFQRLRQRFPSADVVIMEGRLDQPREEKLSPQRYNTRCEELSLVQEQYDFFKACPCTPGAVACGYHNINLGFGCPFECSYCFLQSYTNAPGIVLPANIEDFFTVFQAEARPMRVGSGETTDSLAFDSLTGYAARIVDFFRNYPDSVFEFKTKSDCIEGLLSVRAAENIVAAWSVNPQNIINQEEHFTAPLSLRLDAARRCVAAGYKTAFHFDPIFYYEGWQEAYANVVQALFTSVPASRVAWISLGSLRMTSQQKKMIENRFPLNTILLAELIVAADGKIRYHDLVREKIYKFILERLREAAPSVPVYLCMETQDMWRRLGLRPGHLWGGC